MRTAQGCFFLLMQILKKGECKMENHKISEKELKLTAAIYASRPGVVDFIKATGKLPESIPTGGANIGARILIRERGAE